MKSIYFELDGCDKFTVAEFDRTLTPFTQGAQFCRASEITNADAIVLMSHEAITNCIRFASRYGDRPIYCWDPSDFPIGRLNGLYCSMSRPAHSPRCHANTIYPIEYNEQVGAFDLREATTLISFCGGLTAPIRQKVVETIRSSREDTIVRIQNGEWHRMYDRSGLQSKLDYASVMRRSKFVVCPRGNGFGSIRLFETLKAQRVPVIISDRYVLPAGLDWEKFCVIVREADVAGMIVRCKGLTQNWESMAKSARDAFEQYFSGIGFANYFGKTLFQLQPSTLKLNRTMITLRIERDMKTLRRKALASLAGLR